MTPPPPYQAPRWLRGGHAQTIWPALFLRPARPAYTREVWDTPDGGQIAVDRVGSDAAAPLIVLFHGLEGSSDSHYARALMLEAARLGWRGAVPHFRGCGGVDNTLARAYHAGDSAEVAWILARFAAESCAPVFAAGVSLGGNMLLKYLGETGDAALPAAAAAVSVPLDLTAASTRLDRGLGRRLYTRMFLKTLKPKARAQLARYPALFDGARLEHTRTFAEFDELVTAPLAGYPNARAYWAGASCKPLLHAIRRPTLVLNARNDPFLPVSALPHVAEVAAAVTLEQPEHGGHVGFAAGPFPGRLDWLPRRLTAFFRQHR